MAEANVTESIAADVEAVWAALSDFGNVPVGGPVEKVDVDGEGVGMVRHIHMGGGVISERLEVHDAASHTFTYAIINDDCPLPFSDYSATVVMTAKDGGTEVSWTGTFEPKGVDEAQAVVMAQGIYAGAIGGAKAALG